MSNKIKEYPLYELKIRKIFPFAFFFLINTFFLAKGISTIPESNNQVLVFFVILSGVLELLLGYGFYVFFIKKQLAISDKLIKYKKQTLYWNEIKDIAVIAGDSYKFHEITFEGVPALWFSKSIIKQEKLRKLPEASGCLVFNVSNKTFTKEIEKVINEKGLEPKIVKLVSSL